MQTLKTAIVVLLLMTVMYGSYVSLTMPPEPMPDEVASLIQDSGTFDLAVEDGVPEALPELPVDTGTTDAMAAAGLPGELAPPPFPAAPTSTEIASFDAPPIPEDEGSIAVSGSLSDASMSLSSPSSTPIPGTSDGIASKEDLQLPKPDSAKVATVDPERDYPATDSQSMTLPDPTTVVDLPNSNWNRAATPVGFAMPAAADSKVSESITDIPPSLTVPAAATSEPDPGLANAIRTADRQYAADQHHEALATLSLFYNSPGLSESDRSALISRLDPLAGSVIYSRRHLLEQPYRVAPNETLMEIATRYEIPWQLLANINGIDDPVAVLPGTELKVLKGPFRAEVNLARNELTIFLKDLYAGRFPIAVGSTPAPEVGTFTIQDKQATRTFYDANGSPVPPGDAKNPYGSVWLDLGKQLCIHGSPERSQPSTMGCISLAGNDAEDLYGILSQGSTVTIRR